MSRYKVVVSYKNIQRPVLPSILLKLQFAVPPQGGIRDHNLTYFKWIPGMPLWFRMTVENTSTITSIRCPLWTIIGTAYFRFLQGLLLWNKSGQSNLNRGGCFHCISGALGSASEFQEEAQCLTSSQSGERSRCFTVKSQICFFTSLCGLWVKPRVTILCVIHGENQAPDKTVFIRKVKIPQYTSITCI